MSVSLSPVFNGYQSFLPSGLPNNGGLIYTYLAGSSTPVATYTTPPGNIANANPIVLTTGGYPPQEIWLTNGVAVKFVITDASSNTLGTYDNISSVSSIVNTTNITYNQGSTGAATITQQTKNQQVVSVTEFYANGVSGALVDPTGAIDSTAGMQDALNTGALVYAGKGTFLYSGLTISAATRFMGAGENSTFLQCSAVNGTGVTIGNGTNNPNDVAVSDMTLQYSTAQTSSSAVIVSNAHNVKLERLRFGGGIFNAITLNGGAQQFLYFLKNIEINSPSGSGIQVGVDGTLVQDLWISDSIVSGAAGYGINLLNVSGFYFKDIDILACQNGLRTYPASGKEVVAGIMNNVLCDTCSDWGWNLIDNGGLVAELSLNACWASSCGTSTNAGGLLVNSAVGGVKGLQITGGSFTNNKGGGLVFLAGSKIDLVNVQSFCNSTAGSGLKHGIEFGAGVSDWSVIGGSSGLGGIFGTNMQGYGIMVDAGASTNYRIIGCDVTGNVTGGISDGGTGVKNIYGNQGFVTSNTGEFQLLSGTSSISVPHGLSIAPNIYDISVTPLTNIAAGGVTTWWVSAVSATTFTVSSNTNATAGLFFSYIVRTKGA